MKDANSLDNNSFLETEVLVVGSGAGGANAAKIISKNKSVIIIEEGPYQKARKFKDELNAYTHLYQDGSARTTKDKAIRILQGRAVGGSALINWTTCFRTPDTTLKHWREQYGVNFNDKLDFENEEEQYSIKEWQMDPNSNNDKLKLACEAMDWDWGKIKRNVNGCANLGKCGTGCPINAKQSPLVSSIPAAMENGAKLVYNLKALKLHFEGSKITGLECVSRDGKKKIMIHAKTFVLAGGAVGTPAIMLRSQLKDPFKLVGKRTFLHPTIFCAGFYEDEIEGAKGAPQSIYSDHFLKRKIDGKIGYKLETAPMYPILYSSTFGAHGKEHEELMRQRPHVAGHIALMRDGFHPESAGGHVELDRYDNPVLNYEISSYLWSGMREAMTNLASAQLKSGAKKVFPGLASGRLFSDMDQLRKHLKEQPFEPLKVPVFSAHVMGGCPIGDDERKSVVDLSGRHRSYDNLFVMDGSIFPTSVGANPTESIFAFTSYLANLTFS